jgi:cobalt transporter subunit CbtA
MRFLGFIVGMVGLAWTWRNAGHDYHTDGVLSLTGSTTTAAVFWRNRRFVASSCSPALRHHADLRLKREPPYADDTRERRCGCQARRRSMGARRWWAIFTALANIVTGVGFALVLVAVSGFAGGITGWRAGLLWGFAGFAVFTLAPGLGLPPELPAMPAGDLFARQIWWIGTVIATGAGLALIVFRRNLWLALLGIALIVAPHAIGAPQPASHESPIPEDLHHSFVVAVTITNLVFWLALGIAVGLLRPYFVKGLASPQQSLA